MKATQNIEAVGMDVEALREDLDSCSKNMRSKWERLSTDRQSILALRTKFGKALLNFKVVMEEPITEEDEQGKEAPEDCTEIQQNNPHALDGFYDTKTFCTKSAMRVYCHMANMTGLHPYRGVPWKPFGSVLTKDLWRPQEVSKRCSAVSLEYRDDYASISLGFRCSLYAARAKTVCH